ncbi:hypothetical protein B0T24DRAFT_622270 [Lasiosphaeria ovina]|uniref:Uncharacterized protein n=1 Tax=Lasiosphaeria ovina TaxID=92902 RepID=A0AAE0KBP1_9PEZI|nr:hypothetical protein B0T24DRAFT_622270 [Lasiosphaeria ovina]
MLQKCRDVAATKLFTFSPVWHSSLGAVDLAPTDTQIATMASHIPTCRDRDRSTFSETVYCLQHEIDRAVLLHSDDDELRDVDQKRIDFYLRKLEAFPLVHAGMIRLSNTMDVLKSVPPSEREYAINKPDYQSHARARLLLETYQEILDKEAAVAPSAAASKPPASKDSGTAGAASSAAEESTARAAWATRGPAVANDNCGYTLQNSSTGSGPAADWVWVESKPTHPTRSMPYPPSCDADAFPRLASFATPTEVGEFFEVVAMNRCMD